MSTDGASRRTRKGDLQRQRILRCFQELEQRTGYRPSYRQVAGELGIGLGTLTHHLKVLEQSGTVQRKPRSPRTITGIDLNAPAPAGDDGVDIPFLEQIAAGLFREVQDLPVETRRLPRWLLGSGDFFLLEVSGDSMTGAAIFDGDLAVIRRQAEAQNGEIVVAQIEEHGLAQATLKTLRQENGQAWLVPQNPAYPRIPASQAKIKGKLVLTVHRH